MWISEQRKQANNSKCILLFGQSLGDSPVEQKSHNLRPIITRPCIYIAPFKTPKALYNGLIYTQSSSKHTASSPFTHQWRSVTMQGADATHCEQLGRLAQGHCQSEPGFEPPTLRSWDDQLYLLSYRCPHSTATPDWWELSLRTYSYTKYQLHPHQLTCHYHAKLLKKEILPLSLHHIRD